MKRTRLIKLLVFLFLALNVTLLFILYPKSSTNVISQSKELHTSSNYEYEWLVTYSNEGFDLGYGISRDSSENIYISGVRGGLNSVSEVICLLKYNNNGSLLWNETWGQGFGYDIAINDINSIYLTGYNSGSICLLKYNSSGDILLNKTWESSKFETGTGIDLDASGNIYITGYSEESDYALILLKYNISGVLEWNRTLEVGPSQGWDLVVDEVGNSYVTGYKYNGSNKEDIYILKYNSSGNLDWEQVWGGTKSEFGNGITLDNFDNVYITGYRQNSLNDKDLCVLKYDISGNLKWAKTWGGDENDYGNDIKTDNLGNIYIIGATGSFRENTNIVDIVLVKFDKNGNNLGFKTWGSSNGGDNGLALVLDDSGFAYITGFMNVNFPVYNFVDTFLLKYDLSKIPFNPAIPGYSIYFFIIEIGIIIVMISLIKSYKLKLH